MSILFNPELLKADPEGGRYRSDGFSRPYKKKTQGRGGSIKRDSPLSDGDKHQDLILHGYRCQLFIDEAARQDVEEGKLLIPWMGDKKLMIDRYDCRGSLYSQEEFDPALSKSCVTMTPEEWQIEQDCDEERYRSLKEDDIEVAHLEEEEERRSFMDDYGRNSYQEVGFSYDDSSDGRSANLLQAYYDFHQGDRTASSTKWKSREYEDHRGDEQYEPEMAADDIDMGSRQSDSDKTPERLEEIHLGKNSEDITVVQHQHFQPPAELQVPDDMEVPDTEKQHAIIEKTALFLSKQSGQMEIVLKARQSGNPQFAFLEFGNWLNPYFKLIRDAIKSGTFVPDTSKPAPQRLNDEKESENEETGSTDSDGEYDLHPALKSSQPVVKKETPVVKTEALPTVNYHTTIARRTAGFRKGAATTQDVMRAYLATKYSMPDQVEEEHEESQDEEESVEKLPYPSESRVHSVDEKSNTFHPGSSSYGYQGDEKSWNTYVQEAARAYGCDPLQYQTYLASIGILPPPPPPEEEPSDKRKRVPTPPPPPGVDEDENLDGEEMASTGSGCNSEDEKRSNSRESPKKSRRKQREDNGNLEDRVPPIIPPPPDLKLVVDKLALYVAKNGEEFEEGIKKKNDPRFEFVNGEHMYHPYYHFRKTQYITEQQEEEPAMEKSSEIEGKTAKPVAFSLRKKAQEKPRAKATVTAVFTAEEDEHEDEGGREGYKPNRAPGVTKQEGRRELKEGGRLEDPRSKRLERLKETQEEARILREKQMQMERRRRAAAFIGKLKQQQQQMESSAAERPTSVAEESESSTDSLTDSKTRRHFREKRYIPDEDEPDPKRQKATEEMLEKFKAIRDKIINVE